MNSADAYNAGYQAARDDFTKVALLSPMAMRHIAASGIGAVGGAATGVMSTGRQGMENVPGMDGAYKDRRMRRGIMGGIAGGVLGGGGSKLLQHMGQGLRHLPAPPAQRALPAPKTGPGGGQRALPAPRESIVDNELLNRRQPGPSPRAERAPSTVPPPRIDPSAQRRTVPQPAPAHAPPVDILGYGEKGYGGRAVSRRG
jgi:hypothetical protein